jgi:hypothetical protein
VTFFLHNTSGALGAWGNPEFFNLLFNFEGEGVSGKVGKSPVLALTVDQVE